MSGHTPGPWAAERWDHDHNWNVTFCEGAGNVVRLHRNQDGNEAYTERAEADARLIAAAPDLLDSARRALVFLQDNGLSHGADLARAIAKAEGR